MLVGVTHESPDVVEEWRKAHRPDLPLVVLPTADFEAFLGVTQFPTRAVVGPDGTLIHTGSGSPWSAVEAGLRDSTPGPWIPKAFAKVRRTLRRNDFPRAYDDLMRVLESSSQGSDRDPSDLTPADRRAGERLQGTLESWAQAELTAAELLLESRDPFGAWTRARPIAKARTWFPVTRRARGFLEDLEALPNFEAEREAAELLAEAKRLASDPERAAEAEPLFRQLQSGYTETAAARSILERRDRRRQPRK